MTKIPPCCDNSMSVEHGGRKIVDQAHKFLSQKYNILQSLQTKSNKILIVKSTIISLTDPLPSVPDRLSSFSCCELLSRLYL